MPLSALDDTTGKPVDWWFAYKLPQLANPHDNPSTALGQAQGTEYLYCDATSPSLPKAVSSHPKILEAGALFNTLQQLRTAFAKKDPNIGWMFYNDEHAKINKTSVMADNDNFGHTKGVIAFDLQSDSAFWILHSWPCYPSMKAVDPPAVNFGQTFLCITLPNVAALDAIAKVFHVQSQPQIIEMSIPQSLSATKFPNIAQLAKDAPPARVPLGASEPSDTTFTSKAGAQFRLFAKSKDWLKPAAQTVAEPKDLYADLIGPALQVNLEVETWQDGEPDDDSDHVHSIEDVVFISLRAPLGINAAWNFTHHDHSKWAVSMSPDLTVKTDWVIVADINRIDSQYERGGCGIAFQNPALAASLHSIIDLTPPAAVGKLILLDEQKAKAAEQKRDALRLLKMKGGSAPKTAPATKKTAPATKTTVPAATTKATPTKKKSTLARKKAVVAKKKPAVAKKKTTSTKKAVAKRKAVAKKKVARAKKKA